MSDWLTEKYFRLLSARFRNFKQKSRGLYNWSCHSCGDSKTNSSKARAYAYYKDGKFRWTCHNCHDGGHVTYLIKTLDDHLYGEMLLEKFQNSDRGLELQAREIQMRETEAFAAEAAPVWDTDPFDGLETILHLRNKHQLVNLVERRMIPVAAWPDLYHCDAFYAWAHRLVPEKYDFDWDEPRMVIPFMRKEQMIGFQGRAYGDGKPKYVSGVVDKDAPFLYGWNRLDGQGDVIAVEGPIDSMFLRNGLATGGGLIQAELARSRLPKEVCVITYDNEPRNRDIVRNMLRAAADGWRVCVWPGDIGQKDVNEMVMGGLPAEHVREIIVGNAHAGLQAELMINSWKRVSV